MLDSSDKDMNLKTDISSTIHTYIYIYIYIYNVSPI